MITVLAIGNVQLCVDLREYLDIGVEAKVQTVKISALTCALTLGVTQREVIHTDFVTTLHTDLIVLGHGCAVHILLPVSVVIKDFTIIVAGALIQEGVRAKRTGSIILHSADHVTQISSVLVTAQDIKLVGSKFCSTIYTYINLGGHALTALGVDDQSTVGTLGTIESCGILDNLYTLNILWVETQENIVIEAFVHGGTVILRVDDVTIHDEDRLCVGIQRVDTTNIHERTDTWQAIALDGADITAQLTLDIFVDAHAAGLIQGHLALRCDGCSVSIKTVELSGEQRCICNTILYSYLCGIVTLGINIEGIREGRNVQLEGAILLCQR